MATANDTRSTPRVPTVPVSWLDGMNDLNHRLEAFQAMSYAWSYQLLQEMGNVRAQYLAAGMQDLLQDIATGYRDITDQLEGLMDAYRAAGLTHEGNAHD